MNLSARHNSSHVVLSILPQSWGFGCRCCYDAGKSLTGFHTAESDEKPGSRQHQEDEVTKSSTKEVYFSVCLTWIDHGTERWNPSCNNLFVQLGNYSPNGGEYLLNKEAHATMAS